MHFRRHMFPTMALRCCFWKLVHTIRPLLTTRSPRAGIQKSIQGANSLLKTGHANQVEQDIGDPFDHGGVTHSLHLELKADNLIINIIGRR
jgi:hypothetical protein